MKHNLTGRVVRPQDEEEAVRRRTAEFAATLRPEGEGEGWMARQLGESTVKIDRCQVAQTIERAALSDQAASPSAWANRRRIEVETLAETLPRAPERVAPALRQSRHGCEWLLERWAVLANALEAQRGWTESQAHTAADLLGLPLADRAHDERLALDDLDSGRAMIAAEVEALERMKAEVLDAEDEERRALAAEGQGLEQAPSLRLLRRYESESWRWMERTLRLFHELREAAAPPAGPAPAPEPAPAPVPTPPAPEPQPEPEPEPGPEPQPGPVARPTALADIPPEELPPFGSPEMTALLIREFGPLERLDDDVPSPSGLDPRPRPLNRRARRARRALERNG